MSTFGMTVETISSATGGMVTRLSDGVKTRSKATRRPATVDAPSTQSSSVKKPTRVSPRGGGDDGTHDAADEFEVDRIVEMATDTKNGVTHRKFLVSWVGYDEPTWEPERNIPPSMVTAYVRALAVTTGDAISVLPPAIVRTDEPVVTTASDQVEESLVATACVVAPVSTIAFDDSDAGGSSKTPAGSIHPGGVDDVMSLPDGSDQYEIEGTHRMTTENRDGIERRKFLVAWVGYKERTWEPEDNLPVALVVEFLDAHPPSAHPEAPDSDDHEDRVAGSRCPVCGDGPEGLGSLCARCKKPMHHFCATDVCMTLGLKNTNGEDVVEFPDDTCYCSKACYNSRAGAIRASKRKRVLPARESVESDYEDDGDYGDGDSDDHASSQAKSKKKHSAKKASQGTKEAPLGAAKAVPPRSKKSKPAPVDVTSTTSSWPPPKPKMAAAKAQLPAPTRIRDPLLGKMVAFCADKETWMTPKLYKEVKGLYLSGRVHKPKLAKGEARGGESLYEVRWTVTNFQQKGFFHRIPRAKVEEGIKNHSTLSGGSLNEATWKHICKVPDSEAREDGQNLDEYVILDGTSDVFTSEQMLPDNLELVEQITKLDFQPTKRMQEPPDLFIHEDGTTDTKLIKEKRHHFETASSSFFAYLPLSFWNTVVKETNDYADSSKGKAVTLDELMRFFGIMFFMTIVDKGEYSNYWGDQVEDEIFGMQSSGLGLDKLMTLKRFQFIRKNLCFRCKVSSTELKKDPAARIRPLLNMIKHTSTKYVTLGRNVAVDESSIACRSKFGRHLIVYNSSKPTGKFHFKIYACCCATTWLMVGFRLHCASDMEDRLKGVIPASDARYLENRLQFSSSVRQIVLEVTQPVHNSHRVVNTDNFYTSVTLLLSLRDVGLYGRGTIRENSTHFPKAHMFAKKADEPRGSSLQGISNTGQIIAASWMDGSAVNIISNADSSEMGTVTRLIGKEHIEFPAPKCVSEYNKHMQGVDRLDQLRAKYSLADGHSMQKWHKKLALAFIDIARVNAYVTKCLRNDPDSKTQRNEHRQFMIELASELITGKWKESVEDEGMLFADEQLSTATRSVTGSPSAVSPISAQVCDFVMSKKKFPTATRGKRGCKVCAFEGRVWTMKSIYYTRHNVCLCTSTYPVIPTLATAVCPHHSWTCWRKYHEYYLPRGVFNASGHIVRKSPMFQACRKLKLGEEDQAPPAPLHASSNSTRNPEVDVYNPHFASLLMSPLPRSPSPPESPPTLVFSPFDSARAEAQQALRSSASPAATTSPSPYIRPHTPASSHPFDEYRSPREILSEVPSSEDFGYIVQI